MRPRFRWEPSEGSQTLPRWYAAGEAGRLPTRQFHSTTVLVVRRNGKVVMGGDGQVTMGQTVVKATARKIRRLDEGRILAGFAGSAADGLTLFEKFEAKLKEATGNLCVLRSSWPRTGARIACCAGWRHCCWWPIARSS
jgi:hypothetical protein